MMLTTTTMAIRSDIWWIEERLTLAEPLLGWQT